jgi:hypothetical protein
MAGGTEVRTIDPVVSPTDEPLVPCSCLLCGWEVWVSSHHGSSAGGTTAFDRVAIGSGYKLAAHVCDDLDSPGPLPACKVTSSSAE